MSHKLTALERKALDKMSFYKNDFHISGELVGIGKRTIESLLDLGLIEAGTSERHHGQTGWRVTENAWVCMYGKTYSEIMASDPKDNTPLRDWWWPPLKA